MNTKQTDILEIGPETTKVDYPGFVKEETSDPIAQNIQAVASMHAQSEHSVSWHQRSVERVTHFLGRPGFLYTIFAVVCCWVLWNTIGVYYGLKKLDPAPFYWLQGVIGLGSLLMTTVVLITQNRQGKLAERRAQLDLQVNLLTEQRTAKLISLMEELRRDLPSVSNRIDEEAERLAHAADPRVVVDELEETLKKHLECVEEPEKKEGSSQKP